MAACSTASLMAMPSEPEESGCSARMARPALVSSDGLATQLPPQVSIIRRRYGLLSYDTRTMNTLHSMSNRLQANDSDEPHWPAPVSVVRRLMPAWAL